MERRNWFISPTIGRGVLNHVLESPTDGGDTGHCGAQGDGSQPGAQLLGGVVAVLAARPSGARPGLQASALGDSTLGKWRPQNRFIWHEDEGDFQGRG